MSKITKQSAKELSRDFDAAATAVSNFLVENYGTLSAKEIETIRSLRWTLFDLAEEITQRSIGVILNDIQADLSVIKDATVRAKKAVKALNNVGRTIAIASSLIDLAMAVSTGNVSAIAKSIADLAGLSKKEKSA